MIVREISIFKWSKWYLKQGYLKVRTIRIVVYEEINYYVTFIKLSHVLSHQMQRKRFSAMSKNYCCSFSGDGTGQWIPCIDSCQLITTWVCNSWVVRDVTKNQTKKLSILLSFYFHEVLQYLNTFT